MVEKEPPLPFVLLLKSVEIAGFFSSDQFSFPQVSADGLVEVDDERKFARAE